MIKLPLAVCETILEPYVEEYDIGILNLGVPLDDRIHTLSDPSVLQGYATIYYRFVPRPGTLEADEFKSIELGIVDNLRLVGGTIRGTFRPHKDSRVRLANFLEVMNGKLIIGAITEINVCNYGSMYFADIKRVIGGQVLLEDGRFPSDPKVAEHVINTIVRERCCNPKILSESEIRDFYNADFINILTDCGISLTKRTVGEMYVLKNMYMDAVGHYRINPMLIGGKTERPTGDRILPINVVYIKNQIIKQLRKPKYAHVAATTY